MTRDTALILVLALCFVGFAAFLYWTGRDHGRDAARAALAREQARATQALAAAEQARLAAETERDRLARELEDAANADPVLVPQCLGPDRVRRLNTIR